MRAKKPPRLTGKVCGIVIPYQATRSLSEQEKPLLLKLIRAAAQKGVQEGCGSFLVPLCDEYNIQTMLYLKQLRESCPNKRIIVLAPEQESDLASLAIRIAVADVESLADEVRRMMQPIEDYPLNTAFHCENLKVCAYGNQRDVDMLLADIEYIQPPCKAEIIREN